MTSSASATPPPTPDHTLPDTHSLAVVASPAPVNFTLNQTPDHLDLVTPTLTIHVDKKTAAVSFLSPAGHTLLAEAPDGSTFPPTTVKSLPGASAMQQQFLLPASRDAEHIYGLGQHQSGAWDYRGSTVHLLQENREVAIPVILSSKGYGLLWDNPAITTVDVGTRQHPNLVQWHSEVGKQIDYYFLNGPSPDAVIAHYRHLTGPAPLMPKWLWGFWQCRERYQSQKQLLGVAAEYRKRHLPIDGIIQDWRYWKDGQWGSHVFDPSRYPDPAAMVRQLHDEHVHMLISVWAKFDVGTPNEIALENAHGLFAPVIPYVYPKGKGKWYDAFSAQGRRLYWQQISSHLFKFGIDGWWLDATEPELSGHWGEIRDLRTAMGPGAYVANAYPLETTAAVYNGQRRETNQKRVVILTRSAYAGQQRNSAITWSGDIRGDWKTFANQIPAGLNFSLSGIPYWNTDIGGFFGGKTSDPKYQELFDRWFQFGAFCPMFRVHGTGQPKEFWRWDDRTQAAWKNAVDLRYQLLPYIYSTSWKVTHDGYTMMRPLVMDFPTDNTALMVKDQFLFGPDLMPCPVTQPNVTTREVYLPATPGNSPQSPLWFDFYTNKTFPAGTHITADAPVERIPLFVKPGSILPLGPVVQYAEAPTDAPLELRIYPGADASFTLYNDDGETYDYEKGAHTTIPLTWNDKTHTLTLGKRAGNYPNAPQEQTFKITLIHPNTPTAQLESKEIHYTGEEQQLHLE